MQTPKPNHGTRNVLIVIVSIIATVALITSVAVSGSQLHTSNQPASSTEGGDYLAYLSLQNPNATVVNGERNSCDVPDFSCTITVNNGSRVTFSFLINSTLGNPVKINMVLNATVDTYNGTTLLSRTEQELQTGTVWVNPSLNSESIVYSLPPNAVYQVDDVSAALYYCGGEVSYCGFSNTMLLYVSTAYDVSTG